MAAQRCTVDARISRLAGRAHGVVDRAELLAAGVTRHEIAGRLRRGVLIPAHRGVYRVGHAAPSIEATYMAAVKACGRGAVVSGLAAAYLLGLVKRRPPVPEVTCPGYRRVEGVRTHRAGRIERTRYRGIPVTRPARTLVDIAADLDEEQLARACHEAQVKFRVTPGDVERDLRRKPNAPGAKKLRRILHGDGPVLLSALERGFRTLLVEAGLPLPQTNRRQGAHYVDCRWAAHRLTVELDSYRYHHTRRAWEQDRERERAARARGDDLRRYTWADVFETPDATVAELRQLLNERNAPRK